MGPSTVKVGQASQNPLLSLSESFVSPHVAGRLLHDADHLLLSRRERVHLDVLHSTEDGVVFALSTKIHNAQIRVGRLRKCLSAETVFLKQNGETSHECLSHRSSSLMRTGTPFVHGLSKKQGQIHVSTRRLQTRWRPYQGNRRNNHDSPATRPRDKVRASGLVQASTFFRAVRRSDRLQPRTRPRRGYIATRRATRRTRESLVPLANETPPVLVIFHEHRNHSPVYTPRRPGLQVSTMP